MMACVLLQIIFTVLIDALSTVGKNGQQILSAILKQIKQNSKLLTEFATSGRVESALINHIQVDQSSELPGVLQAAAIFVLLSLS